ncbi:hypothetical protein [Sporosarcina highlanderae]|uniref:Uncharacterized protein n=1 Tax=Sporosarcina highlanderae TaxID=3035916 RepID=A0ABT8JU12_9BACL|nr:hypothetical protein [Sporosarcina highlanderae]MDN4608643.1 hypothetical protein [Sporosarcina highlanderae]
MNERYFAIVNIEQLERQRLFVANIYGDRSGHLTNRIIVAFDGYDAAIARLKEAGVRHVWTSNRRLYGAIIKDSVISGELKHRTETAETAREVEQDAEVLRDIFGLRAADELKPKEVGGLLKIRRWIADQLIKMAIKLGGM